MPDLYTSRTYAGGAPGEVFVLAPVGAVLSYRLDVLSGSVQHPPDNPVLWTPANPMSAPQELPYQASSDDALSELTFVGQQNSLYRVLTIEKNSTPPVAGSAILVDALTQMEIATALTQYAWKAALIAAFPEPRELIVLANAAIMYRGPLVGAWSGAGALIDSWGVAGPASERGSGDPAAGSWTVRIESGARFMQFASGASGANRALITGPLTTASGIGVAGLQLLPPSTLPLGTP